LPRAVSSYASQAAPVKQQKEEKDEKIHPVESLYGEKRKPKQIRVD
jgi:hypothetical protein